jgi:predicted transcriptional regulator of viral defense system
MSTGLMIRKNTKIQYLNRFAELARLGEVAFHTDDLANLWRITNKNTLYTTIKRYVEQGLLFRIHKGFYAIKRPTEINPLLLGIKALHSYAYVSTETILREEGIIQQELPTITLISGKAKRFTVAGNEYYSRKLPDAFLYQPIGITAAVGGVRKASKERAVADMLHFNARAYFDSPKHIDWKKVRAIQKEVGYPVTKKGHD